MSSKLIFAYQWPNWYFQSIQLFTSVVLDAAGIDYHVLLAADAIQKCLDVPELQPELFCALVKQVCPPTQSYFLLFRNVATQLWFIVKNRAEHTKWFGKHIWSKTDDKSSCSTVFVVRVICCGQVSGGGGNFACGWSDQTDIQYQTSKVVPDECHQPGFLKDWWRTSIGTRVACS